MNAMMERPVAMTGTRADAPARSIRPPLGRYRFFAAMFGLGLLGTVLLVLMILPFKYEANVNILVRVDRDASAVPQVGGPGSDQIVVTGVRAEDIATEVSLLTSRAVIEDAYGRLGPEFFADEPDVAENFRQRVLFAVKDALEALGDRIEAVLIRLKLAKAGTPREDALSDIDKSLIVSKSVRSDLIEVRVRAGSPEEARDILIAVSGAYFDAHRAARAVFRGETLFGELQTRAQADLSGVSEDIEAAKRDLGVFDVALWIEQRSLQLVALREAQEDNARDQRAHALQSSERERMLDTLATMPLEAEPLNDNDLIAAFREDIGEALRDQRRDEVRFGPASQQVQESKAVIEALRREMREVDIAVTEREMRALRQEGELLDLSARELEEQAASLKAEIAEMSEGQAKLTTLETRREALTSGLLQVSGDLVQSSWLSALDQAGPARITILEPVTVSETPVAPRKVLILLAGLVVSIVAPIGLFIILTQLFLYRYRPLPDRVVT